MAVALSIRQPWAWLIVQGHKDIENRTWSTPYRGELLIHAGKGMTREEYRVCQQYALERGVKLPAMTELERGGIVGSATLQHCYYKYNGHHNSTSRWFEGPVGWHLVNTKPLPFIRCSGQLGLFEPQIAVQDWKLWQTLIAANLDDDGGKDEG